jgi:hypothetical protein
MGGSVELRNEGDGHINLDQAFIQDCLIRSNYPRRENNGGSQRFDIDNDEQEALPSQTIISPCVDVVDSVDEIISS